MGSSPALPQQSPGRAGGRRVQGVGAVGTGPPGQLGSSLRGSADRQPWPAGALGRLAPADWPLCLSVCSWQPGRACAALGPARTEARVRRRAASTTATAPTASPAGTARSVRAQRRASLGRVGWGWPGTPALSPASARQEHPTTPLPPLLRVWRDEGGTGVGGACEPRPCPMGASVSREARLVRLGPLSQRRHLLPLHRQIQV